MKNNSELVFPTEFYYNHAVKKGPIGAPALSLEKVPLGTPCFMCGRKDFTQAVPKELAIKENFTDYGYCRGIGNHVCIYCASTVTDNARKVGKYCITPKKVLLKSEVNFAAIIKDPPQPPFLLGSGDGQKHTVYKGKVSVSRDIFYIYCIETNKKVGVKRNKIIEINRKEVLWLADVIKKLSVALISTPYAVAMHNFGQKKIAGLSDELKELYKYIEGRYSFETDTCWAALRTLKQ